MKNIATVDPENSSVVPLTQIESYISTVLSGTGFECSSKFLSLFMRQLKLKPWTHIALRFLSLGESEVLSQLDITPSPQKVIHITMLYKGLSGIDELVWGTSHLSLTNQSETWRDVVGEKPSDPPEGRDMFSVYEITWMEVF
ncbi:hypothetical protein FRC08_006631 [Ceratobasidium sp. 394]|nr:hypothetical protein FRC08_006631 [Ceratobasidium sp. 394]